MRTPEDTPPQPSELIRLGTIAAVDLAAARCTVSLGEGLVTGPIRWIEPRAGATRSWSPPSIGEQVILFCPEAEMAAGIALRGVVCNTFPAPGSTLREFVEYQDGAQIGYDPEAHHFDITLPASATARIVCNGGLTIVGDVTIEGDVMADGVSLTKHVHTLVRAGTDKSGKPA